MSLTGFEGVFNSDGDVACKIILFGVLPGRGARQSAQETSSEDRTPALSHRTSETGQQAKAPHTTDFFM
ncbi:MULTISPECIES: hypothetical protein [unclassified Sulfitobacter]|uniref:hypothetical protein n=1 Tax=unclassified Sulfitobacter TaxID=196795 RepID=UPI0023E096BA|nr:MULTISPECIES: hypothetical protein [unclassified Sulfitobacter]MDF3413245.1 hypothetical protein [Sulfitobacter sp. KE5]MDF3523585.1 hypothetical protein [Sulfitobacter sp. S66]